MMYKCPKCKVGRTHNRVVWCKSCKWESYLEERRLRRTLNASKKLPKEERMKLRAAVNEIKYAEEKQKDKKLRKYF